jgi:hypothetical protein
MLSRNLPVALAQLVQVELVCDLSCIHCIGQILLVGKHQQHCIPQLVLQAQQNRFKQIEGRSDYAHTISGALGGLDAHLVEHALQLVPCLADTITIIAVHHEDQTLCVLEVVPPQGADLQRDSKT